MLASDPDILLNPAWAALTGSQSSLGSRLGRAARFDPDVSPFTAVQDGSPEAWADLAALLGPGAQAVIVESGAARPEGWEEFLRIPGVQMVAESVEALRDDDIVALGTEDADEMLALATRTRPGPFEKRTPEFGGYLGIRRDGILVAMAGERLRPPGWAEISAVCTDESARGQGMAGRLVRAVTAAIEARGDRAMLHAAASNTGAIRLYERLGFHVHREVTFAGYLTPGAPAAVSD